MNILVLSSQASNTGSTLRGYYIYKSLKKAGMNAFYVQPPFKSMVFMLDFALSFVYYFFALMNKNYDVVLIIKPYPNTVFPALMLKSRGAKLVIDIDDLDHGYRGGILSDIIEKTQHWLVKKADFLTTHNNNLVKLLKVRHPAFKNKIYMLKQCVDTAMFRVSARAAAAAGKIYKGQKMIFYTAHLNVASYLDEILTAFSMLKRDDVVLVIAGGGPLEGHYRKTARKMKLGGRVRFLGQTGQEETAALMSAADVCLVYYKNEEVNRYRASMKLREYLLAGNKTVATLVGEIKDFKRFVFGSAATPASFAAAINSALKSKKSPAAAHKFIKKEYNWDNEGKLFRKFLETGLKNGA
jgi:glycosyltransferase involved in cell wall biosynthesis